MRDVRFGNLHGSTVTLNDSSTNLTWQQKSEQHWTVDDALTAFSYASEELADERHLNVKVFLRTAALLSVLLACYAAYLVLTVGDYNTGNFWLTVGSFGLALAVGVPALMSPTSSQTGKTNVARQRAAWQFLKDRRIVGHDYIEPNILNPHPNELGRQMERMKNKKR